jgi:hypothetical protein
MPERQERFFWVCAEQTVGGLATDINAVNQQFADSWKDSPLFLHWCTQESITPNHLWLFRLTHSGSRQLAEQFGKQLDSHIENATAKLGAKLMRPRPLPTPLVRPRLKKGSAATDIGLHAVNDAWNATLVTFTYYEGNYYGPPHLQPVDVRQLAKYIEIQWQGIRCECGDGSCGRCDGTGCYNCFKSDCGICGGTGWKDFTSWASERGGYRVDYSSEFPLAQLPTKGLKWES